MTPAGIAGASETTSAEGRGAWPTDNLGHSRNTKQLHLLLELNSLQLEQPALGGEAAAVAAEGAIGGDHAMAGHHNGHGIVMIGHADGPKSARLSHRARDFGVGAGFTERNAEQRLPAAALEVGAAQVQTKAELAPPAGKVLFQLPNIETQFPRRLLPSGAGKLSVAGRKRAPIKLQQRQATLRGGQKERSYRRSWNAAVVQSLHGNQRSTHCARRL